jgi:DNA polymerase III alpha subunit
VKSGDEAMTCEQIATELAPHAQQLQPNLQALATSQQEQYAVARHRLDARRKEHEALAPLATAGALDPTGASKRAYQAAATAQAAKEKSENEADSLPCRASRCKPTRACST